ncbi:MAG TPA: amino acid ABC transporter ATP-binding protein [Patescibacteria group bacterium]|nr:amino acid ABC transporter ATP-binding protein [Patescibacteria group bacterium]
MSAANETATAGVALSVTGLRKSFGGRTILDGVDLAVAPGQTVAVIGPSGGGKSTLLRCLNGLTDFDGGRVVVGPHALGPGLGKGPHRATARQIRRILGMIFQDFQLFPHLTAIENVIEAPLRVLGRPRDEARATAARLLDRVGLADRGDALPRQLSGGQKQRVAIARALAMSPRGLLCDEITSALDPELKGEVLAVLETLRRDGITLMVVTHEIGFARRAADRVVVLDRGTIIEDGPPADVLERPKTARTRQFLSQILL